MALTAEVLFVNPDYMKRMTQLNGGVEDAVMVPAIILAQDKYIQQYLGTDLLEKLKERHQWKRTDGRLRDPFG